MTSETIYQIILSSLAGEATEEELLCLSKWLEESDANQAEYAKTQRLYQKTSLKTKEQTYDVDKAWQNIQRQTIHKKKNISLWLGYAAMFAIVLSIGIVFFTNKPQTAPISKVNVNDYDQPTLLLENGETIKLNEGSFARQQKHITIKNDAEKKLVYETKNKIAENKIQNNHIIIPKGKTYQLILSDGTHIHLNSESELIYPTLFTGNKREVTLIGEAFFEVAKDKEKPFIVKANEMEINVLGTTFNVCSYAKDKTISTTLIEGSVSVRANQGDTQIIKPSEQFTYNKENDRTNIRTVDTELYTSWIDGKYIFKHATLDEIINKLQLWYDFTVVYQDECLKNNRYSLIAEKDIDLDKLLEVISYTSEVKLERTGTNTINIKKIKEEK
ncbi:FecR family protein [Parabacteroides sp. GYB001]|uniref:FecR family protein n=1 Tax=Parabacteroides leei TaxID=2939491 RepID=UPI002018087C|nr:FecR family protein [Parabacteroides leei]MCL3850457.1 FecR family protein [Parabacteroides leei]